MRERGVIMGGAIMKGGYGMQQQFAANNSSRKRWNVYLVTLVILLVFGSAVLGLMGIHRLRDRRIFGLLVKEKDDQIDSLHIRLQREGEHVQDAKMKIEELRMKIYSLRAQKKELRGKIQAMQSTISSLTQEAKTLESTIEEQQNETRLLKEKCSQLEEQNPQVESLTELLRHKEAEIEDLRHRLQKPASTGDRSNLPAEITAEGNLKNFTSRFLEKERLVQAGEGRESENGSLAESAGVTSGGGEFNKLVNVGRNENMGRNGKYDQSGERSNSENAESNSKTDSTDNAGKERSVQAGEGRESENGSLAESAGVTSGGVESSKLVNVGRRNENMGRNGKYDQSGERSNSENAETNSETDSTDNAGNGEQKPKKEDSEVHARDGEGLTHKGGEKLELENHDNKRMRWVQGYLERSRGKRWRLIKGETERLSNSGSDEASKTTEDRQPMKDDKAQDEQVNTEANSRANARGDTGDNMEDSPPGNDTQTSINGTDPENVNPNEAKQAALDMSNQVQNGQQFTNTSSVNFHVSPDEVPQNGSYGKTSELSNGGSEQLLQESADSTEQDSTITQHTENTTDLLDKTKADTDEKQDDNKLENSEETET